MTPRTVAVMIPPNISLLSGGPRRLVGVIATVTAVVLIALLMGGSALFTQTQAFLDFGAGVLSLVSLTTAVLWGLVATDRRFLLPRHRILAQGVHRAGAVAGLGFLALHIWVKVAEMHASPAAAVVPFADDSRPLLVGLGTIAGYLFVMVAATGALRSVFVTPERARQWRALHASAYVGWGAALVHGLKSGRAAAGWVTTAYAVCVIGVAVVLIVRSRSGNEEGTPVASLTARRLLSALPRKARKLRSTARLARPTRARSAVSPVRGEPWRSADRSSARVKGRAS